MECRDRAARNRASPKLRPTMQQRPKVPPRERLVRDGTLATVTGPAEAGTLPSVFT